MKNKYFIVSDVHGFATELKTGLKKAGFQKTNRNHILIILGDIFDRGSEALEVYNYIKSLPKNRRILIKGNHEELFLELLNKKFPEEHDFSNHTADTFCQIAGCPFITTSEDNEQIRTEDYLESGYYVSYGMFADLERIDPEVQQEWNKIKEIVKKHKITKWLKSDEWKDYYELDKYIFVHSFIPLNNDDGLPNYYIKNRKFSYKPDWRTNATELEWSDARWGCPWQLYKDGLFAEEEKNDKMLVCGHWHTSDFFRELADDYSTKQMIFCGKGIIAIDGGVYRNPLHTINEKEPKYIHPQNVLVIDEFFDIYDGRYGIPLADMTPQPYEIVETIDDPSKTDCRLDVSESTYDMTLCCANCITPCARRNMPEGICTVSDLSSVCRSYREKKDD